MNPITHLLLGWEVANLSDNGSRDRSLITWASVAPDLDGLGLLIDGGSRLLGATPTFFYDTYHHVLFHGLFGSLLCFAALLACAARRVRTALIGLLIFHIHLVCDLLGSRGPQPEDVWPIHYLGPFSARLTFSWPGQWPLNDWQNIALTLLLLVSVFRRAVLAGRSPVSLFSRRADEVFVSTLRSRLGRQASGRGPTSSPPTRRASSAAADAPDP